MLRRGICVPEETKETCGMVTQVERPLWRVPGRGGEEKLEVQLEGGEGSGCLWM